MVCKCVYLWKPSSEKIVGSYKEALYEPGGWRTYMYMQGETIPKETNHVRLSKDHKD